MLAYRLPFVADSAMNVITTTVTRSGINAAGPQDPAYRLPGHSRRLDDIDLPNSGSASVDHPGMQRSAGSSLALPGLRDERPGTFLRVADSSLRGRQVLCGLGYRRERITGHGDDIRTPRRMAYQTPSKVGLSGYSAVGICRLPSRTDDPIAAPGSADTLTPGPRSGRSPDHARN